MRHIRGLRESLRFLYELRAMQVFGRRQTKMKPIQLQLAEAPAGFFESMGLQPRPVWVSSQGDVFSKMSDVLHPGDLAYWWDHPGLLLLIPNAPVPSVFINIVDNTCQAFFGTTRLDAYKAAASFHRDMGDLLQSVACEKTFVVYWSWSLCNSPWKFKIQKLTKKALVSLHAHR